jgi:hypothetical protein
LTVPCPQPASAVYDPTFTVTDSDEVQVSAQLPITITARPASGAPQPRIAGVPPRITAIHESASRWREGNKLAQISARRTRVPIGTKFSFSLNEQASVSFSFIQKVSGRKVARKCVAQTPKNAKRKRCTRTVTAGTLSFTAHAGTTTVRFQGRISPSKRLAPGRYTLIITATNSAGARSAPASLGFTIVR